jgi:hypothetical protein
MKGLGAMKKPKQIRSQFSSRDLEARRSVVHEALEEILCQIERATRDVGLHYPICLAVPHSGDAVMTILTTDDPPDQDWSRIIDIACKSCPDGSAIPAS